MKTSLEGMIEIASHEGICLSPYLDSVGVKTIGIGATRSEIPDIANWPWDKELTIKQVFELFEKSLVKYENAVNKALKVKISQAQFDALVSICYNIGTAGLTGSTFMKRINQGLGLQSIAAAILMWNKPKEIVGRRTKEANLYTTGRYSNDGTALLFPVSKMHNPLYKQAKRINVKEYLK